MSRKLATLLAILAPALFALAFAQPESYPLEGEGVFPEGIATTEDGSRFFTGSTTTGTIYEGNVESGEVSVLAEGAAPTAIGIETDPHGRVWVAGGDTGNVFVYDGESGELLRTFETPDAEQTFLNDIAFVDDHVYVTDSFRPVLFRIGAGEELGELEAWLDFEGTDLAYEEGFNVNGIEPTADGEALVVVHSGRGELYRIGLDDQSVQQVDVQGGELTAGDGLVRSGDTLYVTRNSVGEVARVELSEDGTSGEVQEPVTSDLFRFPTTSAVAGDALLVVNSQFDQQGEGGEPELPFSVVRVPLP